VRSGRVRRVVVDGPIDLGLTFGPLVRGRYDPTARFAGGAWWRASNTPAGAVTTRYELEPGAAVVVVTAWGEGAEWALDRAPAWLGDDAGSLPLPTEFTRAARGLRLTRLGTAYDLALATIIEQRVTSIEAMRTWGRLVRRCGSHAPGPLDLRVAPAPARVATLADHERHALGLETRRGRTLSLLAADIARIDGAAEHGAVALTQRLRSLPGVGPWTTAQVVFYVAGDADAVPVGDWHLPSIVAWTLAGERSADDARMLELLEPFRPHRGVALRCITIAGSSPPRRAPRARIEDRLAKEHARA
jgi:3-methyladenine DNA glycosylase/8-oxoguanine DNA glycosylase